MIYDTAGNIIYEPIQNCNCGLTGGCSKCNPLPNSVTKAQGFIGCLSDKEADEMRKKLAEWKKRFNEDFNKKAEELKRL